MSQLKVYLNTLSPDDQKLFAAKCNTTIGYLRKVIYSGKNFGPTICVAIEQATSGSISRKDLNTNWQKIWPELQ